MRYAEVAVDAQWTQQRTFSYSIPEDLSLQVAHSVWVPFGRRVLQGIIFDITPTPSVEETKEIISVIDPSPLLTPAQLELARWIARHYRAPLFDATALMLPPGFRRRVLTFVSLRDGPAVGEPSPAQEKVLEYVQGGGSVELGAVKRALGARAAAAAEQLCRKGVLSREWRWARSKVGPKYAAAVRLAIPRDQAASRLKVLEKGRAHRQAALIDALLQQEGPIFAPYLREAGISLSTAKALEARGLVAVEQVRVHRDPLGFKRFTPSSPPNLTPHQQEAWKVIRRALNAQPAGEVQEGKAKCFLLHGVTGSGKTELYLRALGEVVSQGKRGLVLVPEISLTPQTIDRFGARFPNRVAVLHSKLSLGEQYDEWWRIKEGEFDVVIGSRSAIFAPQPDLGLIVVDEEHDPAYKQADPSPRYHAREVALKLAEGTGAVVVLGSATPDIASYYRSTLGEFQRLELPKRIVTNGGPAAPGHHPNAVEAKEEAHLPRVDIVDLRLELREGNRSIFSRALAEAMTTALDAQEQVILFLNRRGSATFVQCLSCGHALRCRRCDV
ncbi:MAG: primosomal protein N', partial [Dehalococcoidia bacterium]